MATNVAEEMSSTPYEGLQTSQDVATPLFAVSLELLMSYRWISNVILTPIVGVVGITGNALGLWVSAKNPVNRRQTIFGYVCTLMVSDIVTLILAFGLTTSEVLKYKDVYLESVVTSYLLIHGSYVVYVLRHIASAMIIMMSLERLLALLRPFATGNSCLTRYSWLVIIACSVVSIVYMIPYFAGHRIVTYQTADNKTMHAAVVNPGYLKVFHAYAFVVTIVLHYIAPLAIAVLNVSILVAYSRYRNRRNAGRTKHTEDNHAKVTATVVCVSAMHILLSLPMVFVQTLIFTDNRYSFLGEYKATYFFFVNLADLIARINAISHVVVYILVSHNYRPILRTLFCRYCLKSNKVWDITIASNKKTDASSNTNNDM